MRRPEGAASSREFLYVVGVLLDHVCHSSTQSGASCGHKILPTIISSRVTEKEVCTPKNCRSTKLSHRKVLASIFSLGDG